MSTFCDAMHTIVMSFSISFQVLGHSDRHGGFADVLEGRHNGHGVGSKGVPF